MKTIKRQSKNQGWAGPVVWLALLVLVLTVGFYQLPPLAQGQATSLNLNQYQSALTKVQALISSLPQDIFTNPLLDRLIQPIPMPFEAGAVGNDNPFQLPEPPEILLQQR